MKTTSIRILAIAAFVTTTLGVAGFVMAQGHMTGEGPKMGGMMHGTGKTDQMMNVAQNLSPEQQEMARKLNEEFFAATDAQRKQLASKHAELMAQIHTASPDAAKIEALSKEIGTLNGKIMSMRAMVNANLVKAGIPATGHGMMGAEQKSGGMACPMMSGGMTSGGMKGMMHGMASMNHGASSENQTPNQTMPNLPAQGQHNQPGHSK